MDSEPDHSVQSAANLSSLATVTAQRTTHIPPPGRATLREPSSELWFKIAKYYILTVNWITCTVAAFMALILAFLSLFKFNDGPFFAFAPFALLILTVFMCFISLYIYKFPIKGAADGYPTRLVIHGIICGLTLIMALDTLAASYGPSMSTGDPIVDQSLNIIKTSTINCGRLIIVTFEMIACYSMAYLLMKKRRMIRVSTYNA